MYEVVPPIFTETFWALGVFFREACGDLHTHPWAPPMPPTCVHGQQTERGIETSSSSQSLGHWNLKPINFGASGQRPQVSVVTFASTAGVFSQQVFEGTKKKGHLNSLAFLGHPLKFPSSLFSFKKKRAI